MSRYLCFGSFVLIEMLGCGAESDPEIAVAEVRSQPAESTQAAAGVCRIVEASQPLPEEVRETSGLAQSRLDPEIFWTHNDAGSEPVLFAVNGGGQLVARASVEGADLEDWEDLAAGPCEAGSCLYIGDIGDNDGERDFITIYKVPEPAPGGEDQTAGATALRARFPDGPQDAEALFILPSQDVYVITKGEHGPITLYRYPAPHRPGETVPLEQVKQLWPHPDERDDRVTAAAASPDGRWAGIRTYRTLYLYPTARLVQPGDAEPVTMDLQPLGEGQGEAIAIGDDGTVWLTSEAESEEDLPRWAELSCTFPSADR